VRQMVRAILHIIDCEQLTGPVNVLAPEVVTNRQFARTLGRILHRPVFLKIPGFVLRLAMGEVAGAIAGGDAWLKPDKILASGFRFAYPDLASALRHELFEACPAVLAENPAVANSRGPQRV
jgi:NAD dependent epimerase/dehydratase family enzyme